MSFLHRMDDFLLGQVAQPAADWIEHRTGVSPYRLAANLFLADAAMTIPRTVSLVQDGSLVGAAVTGFTMLVSSIMAYKAHWLDGRRSSGTMNPARATYRNSRPFVALSTVLVALPSAVVKIWHDAYTWRAALLDLSFVAFTAAIYFLACNSPPPRQQEALDHRMAASAAS